MTVPSSIFSSACCTPSPLTSLVMLMFSLFFTILSTCAQPPVNCLGAAYPQSFLGRCESRHHLAGSLLWGLHSPYCTVLPQRLLGAIGLQ